MVSVVNVFIMNLMTVYTLYSYKTSLYSFLLYIRVRVDIIDCYYHESEEPSHIDLKNNIHELRTNRIEIVSRRQTNTPRDEFVPVDLDLRYFLKLGTTRRYSFEEP